MDTSIWSKISVFCDEEADRQLFLGVKRLLPELNAIPNSQVKVYSNSLSVDYALVKPLITDDRPDFIMLKDNKPLLVVELTEHGYTGDNPLQRFTRLAAAAENSVPVIYFGPFARVRDDELDLVNDPSTLSKRRVNTDLFKAMDKLSNIFSVPLAIAEWITGKNGKPIKVGRGADDQLRSLVFGQLVYKIRILLEYSLRRMGGLPLNGLASQLDTISKELKTAYANPNVRGSQTKLILNKLQIKAFVEDPTSILKVITPVSYFMHDKPERLLAMLCIRHTELHHIEVGNTVLPIIEVGNLFEYLCQLKPGLVKEACFYYTGYKWRSDPHCGVLVNIDYLKARPKNEKSAERRDMPLVLYYPRIYLKTDSPNVKRLHHEISRATVEGSEFNKLFMQRYGDIEGQKRANDFLNRTTKRTAKWSDSTKQARIFRRYCDFIFLEDAVLLGTHLKK